MRQLGVQFLKISARVDAAIMKEINDFLLKEKRMALATGSRSDAIPDFGLQLFHRFNRSFQK